MSNKKKLTKKTNKLKQDKKAKVFLSHFFPLPFLNEYFVFVYYENLQLTGRPLHLFMSSRPEVF